jgi:hypothetical protein
MTRRVWLLGIAGTLALVLGTAVEAHTTLPAYLELNELGTTGTFQMIWRVPANEGLPPAIAPVLPAHCYARENPSEVAAAASVFASGIVECGTAGLVGGRVRIDGLQFTLMDAMVRITFLDNTTVTRVLRGAESSFVVTKQKGTEQDVTGYVRLGFAHILGGIDHLMFVFGLLLLVTRAKPLVQAITAFTVAHSITLALAVFGVVRVAPAPIEAVIALSVVFLAVELMNQQRGQSGLTQRRPWLVAFAFGLLHGLGFAGTLSQIGIPQGDVPSALLFFNVGVELGQLAFIGAVLWLGASMRSLEMRMPRRIQIVQAYGLGTCASYWCLQRCALMIFGA